MRVTGADPIPSVFGIAPVTLQVAAAAPDENAGNSDRDSFALQAVEDLGATIEFRQDDRITHRLMPWAHLYWTFSQMNFEGVTDLWRSVLPVCLRYCDNTRSYEIAEWGWMEMVSCRSAGVRIASENRSSSVFVGVEGCTIWGCRLGKVFISDLVVQGVIGVNAWEREHPRDLVINIELTTDFSRAIVSDDIADCVCYQKVAEKLQTHAASIERFTVEALASDFAALILAEPGVESVRVRVDKPGAVASCRSVGVEIERVAPGFE